MILYEVISTYHLLCVCAERMRHPEQKADLLIYRNRLDRFPHREILDSLFRRVILFDIGYQLTHTEKQLTQYFLSLLEVKLPLADSYERIYCSCGQHAFGAFLACTQTPFVFCEDAAGLLSRPEILESVNAKVESRKAYNTICSERGLYDGTNPAIIARRCNIRAQVEGFQGDNIENFDVIDELKKLSESQRETLIGAFVDKKKIAIPPKSTVFLTQHFANLETLTFIEQILLYQMIVDYYFNAQSLVIKPHPDDRMYYSELFPKVKIIRERFPSEFMPFLFDNQPECVATVSSTAIFNLRGHYPKVFELDTRYESDFPMTHRYYAAMMIAKRLGLDVVCHGANDLLARRLCETLGENASTVFKEKPRDGRPYLLLIDDVTAEGEAGRDRVLERLEGLEPASCAVMINSLADYCWYRYERRALWQNIAPFVLTKAVREPRGEDFYASTEDEVIFIYSKSREVLKLARETEIEKELPHVGITVKSAQLDEKDEKIKMLEGILEATEKRLLYYIEKERGEK